MEPEALMRTLRRERRHLDELFTINEEMNEKIGKSVNPDTDPVINRLIKKDFDLRQELMKIRFG
jgi:uncharacterized protein YdcH (DUF465 family)